MPEQWLTYRQLGELWNTSPEAARARSRRGHYERRTNEHGTTEVLVNVDGIVAGSYSGPQTWAASLEPYGLDQGAPEPTNEKMLHDMEEQIAALRWECRKAEQQVELLRRHLETEREQSAQLMKVLLQRQHGGRKGRRFIARLLFWRKSPQVTVHETVHAVRAAPDALRPAPVAVPDRGADAPDILGSAPVIRPDNAPDTPDIVSNTPDIPRETSPDSRTSPLSSS